MNLGISIILSLLLGLIAYLKRALTMPALIFAVLFSTLITYFGGLTSFIILVVVFLGSIITKLFHKSKKSNISLSLSIFFKTVFATFKNLYIKILYLRS